MRTIIIFAFYLIVLIIFSNCGKNEVVNIETTLPSGVTYTKARLGGSLRVDKNTTILVAGICWATNDLPTINDNKKDTILSSSVYYFDINNLNPNTTYYARAFATTSYTTYYGSPREFKTRNLIENGVLDVNENVYNTIVIGSQTWMVQNLKSTNYRNEENITFVQSNLNWTNSTMGGQCYYGNQSTNNNTYGLLYNWMAVNDQRQIAPVGWRVATEDDWNTLIQYLGGVTIAGGKLKQTGTNYWTQPNTGATNESGFTARAGGFRNINGVSNSILNNAFFWTSSAVNADSSVAFQINFNNTEINRIVVPKNAGLSVRCIKE